MIRFKFTPINMTDSKSINTFQTFLQETMDVITYQTEDLLVFRHVNMSQAIKMMFENQPVLIVHSAKNGPFGYASLGVRRSGDVYYASMGFNYEFFNLLAQNKSIHQLKHTALHEIYHTLGGAHEHQRPDRNKYLKLGLFRNLNNIFDEMRLGKLFNRRYDMHLTYDYFSISHYRLGQLKATVIDSNYSRLFREAYYDESPLEDYIGRREYLSIGDILFLNSLYHDKPLE
jgi:hypothetical protein